MQKRVPGLDGLRALSAVAVALQHFGTLRVGWFGVQVFFVLSGYLITGILLEEPTGRGSLISSLKRFYYRRSLRIFPLYYFFILCFVVAGFLVAEIHRMLPTLPWLLTYTLNVRRALIDFPAVIVTHLWSLAVEEQFYLLWPLVVLTLPRRYFRHLTLAILLLSPVLRLIVGVAAARGPEMAYFLTPFQLDSFAAGALLATLQARQKLALFRPLAIAVGLWIPVALVFNRHLTAFGFAYPMDAGHKSYIWGYTLIDLAAAVLVLACINHTALARALDWAPLRYLGQRSYGFYVWHMSTLFAIRRGLGPLGLNTRGLPALLLFLAATVVVCDLSFRFVEAPFLRLKDRYSRHPEASGATGQAEAPAF